MEIIIEHKIPIEGASKTQNTVGVNMSGANDWTVAVALARFRIGEITTTEILGEEIARAMILQRNLELCDNGLSKMYWNGEKVIFLTQ